MKGTKFMAIIYDNGLFTLHTKNTTYQMKVQEYGFLLHLYYGKRLDADMSYMLTYYDRGTLGNPYDAGNDSTFSLDALPQEFPCYGNGDYRSVAFNVKNSKGVYGCDLRYKSYEIIGGKYSIPKLPAVYEEETKAQTLKVILEDKTANVEVTLLYGVLEDLDVITRSVIVRNIGQDEIKITKIYSASLDLINGTYDLLHFHGRHAMERNLERTPVMIGRSGIHSLRGTSSHQHNPFVILADSDATEDYGNCYGMSFLFSGNFSCEIEKDQLLQTRIGMGLQSEMFEYPLGQGEVFYAPEVAMAYSANGLTELSQIYHRMIRHNVCRGAYKTKRRPVLINNWEATYFNFTGDKIIEIAKQAAELGVEMLVLDDGWFGARNSDFAGLGDWYVNEEKMGAPLAEVAHKITEMGMKFGLWIEPEMVNEDSDLYRTHPDWAFQIPGRKPVRGRHQLVLDFSRPEIVDNIFEQISAVIDQLDITYIKMDNNRSIMDIYTATEGWQNQGKIMYEYTLGVYNFIERLLERYPDILIEGCCGGGGRFDAGMLYYTPQIWCSDNTDAIERIKIQHGTSFGYPVSVVGAHVSAVPNEQTGRMTNIHTRSVVAMSGSFGYELDLNLISEQEKEEVKQQIQDFKKYWDVIHNGKYYRLHTPGKDREVAAWQFASEDGQEALMNIVMLDVHCNGPVNYVKFKGLSPEKNYCIENVDSCYPQGTVYNGGALMSAGLPLPVVNMLKENRATEYQAYQIHLVACE